MSNQRTSFYVQLEPEFYRLYGAEERPRLRSVKAVNLTQKRPTKPKSGTITVKLTVDIPNAAFYPLEPEAIITIPADLTEPTPVEVTAEDPRED